MAQTTDRILQDIEGAKTTLGIEYGSTRIKAVLDDSENNPIAVGTFDWENTFDGTYWTYGRTSSSPESRAPMRRSRPTWRGATA